MGSQELREKTIVVKDMQTGEQRTVAWDELPQAVTGEASELFRPIEEHHGRT
ncbi:MAG: His/Gly/Thr/Pro-type tRNA ligase C-terminal domain-containing protein [Thermodesulfobacteriota bacterium]